MNDSPGFDMDSVMRDVDRQSTQPVPVPEPELGLEEPQGSTTPLASVDPKPFVPPEPGLEEPQTAFGEPGPPLDAARARRKSRLGGQEGPDGGADDILPEPRAPASASDPSGGSGSAPASSWKSKQVAQVAGLAPVVILGYLFMYSMLNTAPPAPQDGAQANASAAHRPNMYSLSLFVWLLLLPLADVAAGAFFNRGDGSRVQWPDIPQLFVPDSCNFVARGSGGARVPFDMAWWPSAPSAVVTAAMVAGAVKFSVRDASLGAGSSGYIMGVLGLALAATVGSRWFLGCDGGYKGLVTGLGLGVVWGLMWAAIDSGFSKSSRGFRRDGENFWNLRLLSAKGDDNDHCTAYPIGGTNTKTVIADLKTKLAAAEAEKQKASNTLEQVQEFNNALVSAQVDEYEKDSPWLAKKHGEGVWGASQDAAAANQAWQVGKEVAFQRTGGGSAPPGVGTEAGFAAQYQSSNAA